MSPSQAGSSQGSSWTIFSSARLGSWTFLLSSEISLFRLENQPNQLGLTLMKIRGFQLKKTSFMLHERSWKFVKLCFYHEKSTKLGNLIAFVTCTKNLLLIDIHKVSSVSARKLKCPSSVRLGSKLSQLGLARAGKFQLEPITSVNPKRPRLFGKFFNFS